MEPELIGEVTRDRVSAVEQRHVAQGDDRSATGQVLLESEGLEILNVIGSSSATLAKAAVAAHVQGPNRRLENELESVQLNPALSELGLVPADVEPMAFRNQLRQSALRQRRTQNRDHCELAELSVGFVDLVEFVRDFERSAHGAARRHDVQIAKPVGDEMMIVAAAATAFATDLITTFRTGDVAPQRGHLQVDHHHARRPLRHHRRPGEPTQ